MKKVKAVIFVPYTHGSFLAKKLREAEFKLEDLTGYRLKVVERAGTTLEHIHVSYAILKRKLERTLSRIVPPEVLCMKRGATYVLKKMQNH